MKNTMDAWREAVNDKLTTLSYEDWVKEKTQQTIDSYSDYPPGITPANLGE